MIHFASPADRLRFTAQDVALLGSTNVAAPVTTGLTGTVTLRDWDSNAIVQGPTDIVLHHEDDWYVDVDAPAVGRYRVEVIIQAGGAQRTLRGELKVEDRSV